jgi:hypothetical protein
MTRGSTARRIPQLRRINHLIFVTRRLGNQEES